MSSVPEVVKRERQEVVLEKGEVLCEGTRVFERNDQEWKLFISVLENWNIRGRKSMTEEKDENVTDLLNG